MERKVNKFAKIFFVILFLFSSFLSAKGNLNSKCLDKTSGTPSRTRLNINYISTWITNNGEADNAPTDNSGFIYPKGKNLRLIFQSGLVWGGIINGEIRVGGSTYTSGLLPGRIIGTGENAVREDSSSNTVRIFRVRRDYANPAADFTSEINDGEGTRDDIFMQYKKDWEEWPAQYGAPYEDIDGNGIYNPEKDIPGVPGADQTIWFVANDLDSATCKHLYGSNPMGLEMQVTLWGYNRTNHLGNIIFKKYILINKGKNRIDSMYISMWSDPDNGDAADDYCGYDTSASLMYAYNGVNHIGAYGDAPTAVGFNYLQGPIVKGEADDVATFKGKYKFGFKNLPVSVHYSFICADGVYRDPRLYDYEYGTLAFYNLFRGLTLFKGEPFIDPTTNKPTTFVFAGDPVTNTGWTQGFSFVPGDIRQGMVAGPFTMAVGDTQEVIFAELAAFGKDNIDAITELRKNNYYAQKIYDGNFKPEKVPYPKPVEVKNGYDDENIVISWENFSEIESFDENGFRFQGYNVYQVPQYDFLPGKSFLIKTFDKKDGVKIINQMEYNPLYGYETLQAVQFGTDSGIEHSLKITKDYFGEDKFLIGKTYHFGVTAYTYNANSTVDNLISESPITIISVKYMGDANGPMYGDAVKVTHISGTAPDSLTVFVSVNDVTQLKNKKYKVSFVKKTLQDSSGNYLKYLWRLTDEFGNVIINNAEQQSWIDSSIIAEGIMVKVNKINSGLNYVERFGNSWLKMQKNGIAELNPGYVEEGYKFIGSSFIRGRRFPDVVLNWAGCLDRADSTAEGLAAKSMEENPNVWSKGAVYLKNNNYTYAGKGDIPFVAYTIKDGEKRRLNVCLIEDAEIGSANNLFDMGWDGSEYASQSGNEYLLIMNSDYDEGAEYDENNFGLSADVLYVLRPRGATNSKYLASEYRLGLIAYKNYTEDDIYEFNPVNLKNGKERIPEDYSLFQNFPNPFNPSTTIKYSVPVVTGYETPVQVTLKIYDILGREVRTLVNNEQKPGSYEIVFNANGLSSGVYFYRLQSGNFAKTMKMLLIK